MVDGDADERGTGAGLAPDDDIGLDYLEGATLIGSGGFAHVYAATDTRFDRRVAVKVFDDIPTEADRTLFEAECRTMGRLSGLPHVVTVHDIDYTADGRPCIVMALIAGGSLGDRLRRDGLIPWRRAVGWLITVLRTLAEAHQQGILHRDLKPENILVDGDHPYLTDFGLASLRTGTDTLDAADSQVIASPLHAPPETFSGTSRDERSDLYSAASTLYTLIAGHAPFQRHPDLSTDAIVERLRTQTPPRLPAGLAPPDLDALIQQGLAKDPADRPQTAIELADALQAVLDAHRVPARPAPDGGAAPAVPLPAAAPAAPSPPPVAPSPSSWGSGPGRATPTPASKPASTSTPSPTGAGTAGQGPPRQRGWETAIGVLVAAAVLAVGFVTAANNSNDQTSLLDIPDPTYPYLPSRSTTAGSGFTPTTNAATQRALAALPPPWDDAEAGWVADRAAVVAEIGANGWRWDETARTVSGPGGLLVDLAACPEGWDPYEGIGTDELLLGQIFRTGTPEEADAASNGFRAYFQYLNATGGLLDPTGGFREVVVGLGLDDPLLRPEQRTVSGAFALQTAPLGAVDQAADDQNAACIPDPFVLPAGPGWNDPAQRPWVWTDRLSPGAEGRLLGEIVARSFPDRGTLTVAALVTTDDAGRAAEQALRRYLSQSAQPTQLVVTQIDLPARNLARRMLDLVLTQPDALLVLSGDPQTCAYAASAALEQDEAPDTMVVASSSACASLHPSVPADAASLAHHREPPTVVGRTTPHRRLDHLGGTRAGGRWPRPARSTGGAGRVRLGLGPAPGAGDRLRASRRAQPTQPAAGGPGHAHGQPEPDRRDQLRHAGWGGRRSHRRGPDPAVPAGIAELGAERAGRHRCRRPDAGLPLGSQHRGLHLTDPGRAVPSLPSSTRPPRPAPRPVPGARTATPPGRSR